MELRQLSLESTLKLQASFSREAISSRKGLIGCGRVPPRRRRRQCSESGIRQPLVVALPTPVPEECGRSVRVKERKEPG